MRRSILGQIIALEGSNMNMQTFNAMRSGAKAMQDARGRLDVDQVDDVMDDIKDEMDIAEQVSRRGWRPPALSEKAQLRASSRRRPPCAIANDLSTRRCGKLATVLCADVRTV